MRRIAAHNTQQGHVKPVLPPFELQAGECTAVYYLTEDIFPWFRL